MRESELRESERGEREWITVRNRRRGRVRVEQPTDRADPRQNYKGNRFGQQGNWRNRMDITSYYFTRFSDETMEKELWMEFKKWGDVREIFVSRQRNKRGRRYGFVRFKGVTDDKRLERQLDNIIIGGLKMYVNLPKYGRDNRTQRSFTANHGRQGQAENVNDEIAAARDVAAHGIAPKRTYAKILNTSTVKIGQRRFLTRNQHSQGGSHSSVQLQVGEKGWYTDAWVGRLKKIELCERAEDEIFWTLGSDVTPKYLGDDMIILMGLSDMKAEALIKEEVDKGSSLFYSLERWKPEMRPGNKLVWIQCWGIPLAAWDIEHIRKIVAATGDLVDVDDDVEEKRRLDRARVLIRTPWQPVIQHSVTVHIGAETHTVFMVEETNNGEGLLVRHGRSTAGSSEEIFSEDTDPDSPFSRLSVFLSGTIADNHVSGPLARRIQKTSSDGHGSQHGGGQLVRWAEKLPSGEEGIEDPLDKDRCSRVHCPNLETYLSDTDRRIHFEGGAVEPSLEADAACGKMETHNVQISDNWEAKNDLHVRKSKGRMESILEIKTNDLTHGEQEVETDCFKGAQQHSYKFKMPLDPSAEPDGPNSNLGLGKNIPDEALQGLSIDYTGLNSNTHGDKSPEQVTNNYQQLRELGSKWKVYSRGTGCRKNKAHVNNSNTPCKENSHPQHKLTQAIKEMEAAKQGNDGQHAPPDSGPREPETESEKSRASQTKIPCNNYIREEASAQWEMAKILGMTSGEEQSTIIDKITTMEIRDRKEAEALGKRNISS
ncbi:hypothetical protein GLYMA_16G096100v4 [Glycine max]|uniref:RRM domain-containing protein n=1 Tax=Glycine max TaxID=3847 RepID=K7MGJ8_SOYBN|nr:hypothetical protein JHK86_044965 [Glycine max]KAG4951664.1 hypothetical protein JHK85_045531 [Glycine max]KAH1150719.1 hypothetical protein GYH30_044638 [Glycine max]KRH07583.1 hypothetical protein GLYMA_16G096100v4 [Glycine max]